MAEKIITGDEVVVIAGKDKGARGRVRQNLPREDRLIVEGINIVQPAPKGCCRRAAGGHHREGSPAARLKCDAVVPVVQQADARRISHE